MVESSGGSERAWFFSAEEPSEPAACSACHRRQGNRRQGGSLSLIQVSGGGDARTLACDLLTQAYVPQKAQDGAFSVTGTDDRSPRRWRGRRRH